MSPLAIAITILLLPLGVFAFASLLGGWFFLAREYPDRPFVAVRKFAFTSGYMGRGGFYWGCISIGINSFGIRLSIFPLFRFMHPPLVIPWSEVKNCSRVRFYWFFSALRLDIARRASPIYFYNFLGKYGDADETVLQYWQKHTAPASDGNGQA